MDERVVFVRGGGTRLINPIYSPYYAISHISHIAKDIFKNSFILFLLKTLIPK